MPTYDYKCQDCKRKFEIIQRMTESPKRKCPKCGGRVRRLISGGTGFIFKGSGFYATDHRSDSYKKRAAEEKPKPPADAKSASESPKGSTGKPL